MLKEGLHALRAGHWPSLLGAWLHFEVSFMVWLLIGALSIPISEDFGLSAFQKGLLVGIPLLGGSLLRIVVGPLGDWAGAKTAGLAILGLEAAALLLGWQWATSFESIIMVGLLLGIAGASFAIALPLASQAYPPAHQGLAMGVAAVGNSGVLLASLLAPRLAALFGWQHVFGLMLVPVLGTGVVFFLLVKSSLSPCESQINRGIFTFSTFLSEGLRHKSMYWLCGLYAVTFGGFVGLSSYLPIFFHDQFQLDMVRAGTLTALIALAGSVARPIGGYLADRLSGITLLPSLFVIIVILCWISGQVSTIGGTLLLIFGIMLCLGFGNGVVFQVVSSRFQGMMGTASGFIGAAGGLGGFLLSTCFGWLKDLNGTFSAGFYALGFVSGIAAISVMIVQRSTRFRQSKSISSEA